MLVVLAAAAAAVVTWRGGWSNMVGILGPRTSTDELSDEAGDGRTRRNGHPRREWWIKWMGSASAANGRGRPQRGRSQRNDAEIEHDRATGDDERPSRDECGRCCGWRQRCCFIRRQVGLLLWLAVRGWPIIWLLRTEAVIWPSAQLVTTQRCVRACVCVCVCVGTGARWRSHVCVVSRLCPVSFISPATLRLLLRNTGRHRQTVPYK